MDDIRQQFDEIEQLKQTQELHRKQLQENRALALKKRRETKYFVSLGKIVADLILDAACQTEDEIREMLKSKLISTPPDTDSKST